MFPLMLPGAWASLVDYLAERRAKFFLFLYRNRQTVEFERRYLDLFWADVVSVLFPINLGARDVILPGADSVSAFLTFPFIPSSWWDACLPSLAQDVSLTLTGINACVSSEGGMETLESFRQFVQRLHIYSNSDDMLWSALTSGCFDFYCLDVSQGDFPIHDWWLPTQPLPTVASVLWDWERACIAALSGEFNGSDGVEWVKKFHMALTKYSEVLEEGNKVLADALERITSSNERLDEISALLSSIFYNTTDPL
ncbi:hypothetical protein NMY22_g12873 [Coprinellus aureogranulatus]|nr:hypothetical protein NMY22_g12873 [Coprinellus aureogranulatus]